MTAQPRERTVEQSSSSAPGPARIYLKIYIFLNTRQLIFSVVKH